MRGRLGWFRLAAATAGLLASGGELLAQHEGDVWVGRSQAGLLKLAGFDTTEHYVPLMPVSGLLQGWTDNDPGFDRLLNSAPADDLYILQPGAQIWLQWIDGDQAFRAIDSSFFIVDDPGEQTFLGNQNLHTHLTWHINSVDAEFDSKQCVWEATFLIHDVGATGYEPTPPFTMKFTNVPLTEADGDFDEDQDADLDDYAAWGDCAAGPEARPVPIVATDCEIDCLNAFDFDQDHDVDVMDFASFLIIFGEE